MLKRIVSVSIGSSKRDNRVQLRLLDEDVIIERIGTDGNVGKAIETIRELDGKVDAFGMGGIDLYLWSGKRRYILREAKKIALAAQKTPIVDGSGLKNTLERRVINHLAQHKPGLFQDKKVLMVCAMDRFGMAEALLETGCTTLYGDLLFALGVNVPLYNIRVLDAITRVIAPLVVQLPISMLYPTGKKQDEPKPSTKFKSYYDWADIVAGDFHMIRKYLPEQIENKTIITNTVTQQDIDLLKKRGASRVITTTPNLQGRSFGTNVMEALMVAYLKKPLTEISPEDYHRILDNLGFAPRIEEFLSFGA